MSINRRTFLRNAAVVGVAAPAAAASLLGLAVPDPAEAAPAGGLPDYAPVPPAAFGPKPNASGYHVGRIAGNYSHSHADHIGAAAILGDGVVRIAHAETKRLLRADRDSNRPLPTVTFEDSYHLNVGGEHVELTYHGPNHTPDNIFIRIPSARTLMVVDLVFPGWVPFKNLAQSQDIPAWRAAHDLVLDAEWDTYVGGHLGRLGTRADVQLQREYVADLTASTIETLNTLDTTPYFAKYGPSGNAWAISKSYLDDAANLAAEPITAKYLQKLGGADVFTVSNAEAMITSTRIDAGILGSFGIHP